MAKVKSAFFICFSITLISQYALCETVAPVKLPGLGQKKISEQILLILKHYKGNDPVGIPGAPIPDPLDVPPFSHKLALGRMNCKNVKIFGLKKFRIDHIKADIAKMEVEAALTIDRLNVFGNYTLSTFFSRAEGPFTVQMNKVFVKAIATMEVERTGHLEAQDITMDLTFEGLAIDFKNLGFFASMFQGMVNSVGTSIFNSIKPFILKEVNKNILKDVNKEVRKLPKKFPNSISPIDQALVEVRKEIRNRGFDPFKVNDYNNSVGIFDVYVSHTWIYGLSSVHRTGDIQFQFKNNTLYASLQAGTQQLKGVCDWEFALVAGMISKIGKVDFTIDYFRVEVSVSQTADTSKAPKLEDIQLELGNIQVRFDGAGTLDYLVEFGVNVLPNLLRYQIMDSLESPVKTRIQEALNTVNVETLIKENADKIDNPNVLLERK